MFPFSLLLVVVSIQVAPSSASGQVHVNGTCNLANNRLDPDTHRFVTDCDATTYCNSQGMCVPKGCRRDIFPYGYGINAVLPPLCPDDQFCPDEGDACQPLVPVGQPCQLNRDDECKPPPDSFPLSSLLNTNGSICLSFTCQYANATLGSPCIVENTAYTAYESSGGAFAYIVSRDNCRTVAPGGYCDGSSRVCMATKALGATCEADKECDTYNCDTAGVCAVPPGTPRQVALWEYIVTAIGAAILILGLLIGLSLLHRSERTKRQAERRAYWREQTAYRHSLLALSSAHPARPGTMYSAHTGTGPGMGESTMNLLSRSSTPSGSDMGRSSDVGNMGQRGGGDAWGRESEESHRALVQRPPPGRAMESSVGGGSSGSQRGEASGSRLVEQWRPDV